MSTRRDVALHDKKRTIDLDSSMYSPSQIWNLSMDTTRRRRACIGVKDMLTLGEPKMEEQAH